MSFNLPDKISLPTNPGRHNTAIAEVVIWGTIWTVGLIIRSFQEWYYWDRSKKRTVFICIFNGWIRNLIVILSQVRIVGFALYLAKPNAAKGLVITEIVLQGIGVTPLLFEFSLVLLKCGHVGLNQRHASHYPHLIKLLLQWIRLPIIVAVVLIVLAGSLVNITLMKSGACIILAIFAFLIAILLYLVLAGHFRTMPPAAQHALRCVAAAVPFYAVRITYMMLGNFGGIKYSPAVGDWKLAVGLEFVMEIAIVFLLITASLFAQPIIGNRKDRRIELSEIGSQPLKEDVNV
ncbi:uncharacterized protein PV09_05630 [Verruconis gallopava]|uniref:DUF7702 domain-containing protein n=1 Tax=Verruconis gallopava TaxID=253628 RepID=A0A0D2AV00_9PEZI|nr:uncharacterized protein PV09_05630 [Verruconis gallopava]KIW02969.1 hypothetical protein PV09_05630 [Verruconis gallopava]